MGYRYHPFEVPCSGCRALIVWFRTASGKRMPVNAETTKPMDAAHQLDLSRHKSHFATCPAADSCGWCGLRYAVNHDHKE